MGKFVRMGKDIGARDGEMCHIENLWRIQVHA